MHHTVHRWTGGTCLPLWYSPVEPDWMKADQQRWCLDYHSPTAVNERKTTIVSMSAMQKRSRTGSLSNPCRSDLIGKKTTSKLNWWHSSLNLLSCFGTSGQRLYVASRSTPSIAIDQVFLSVSLSRAFKIEPKSCLSAEEILLINVSIATSKRSWCCLCLRARETDWSLKMNKISFSVYLFVLLCHSLIIWSICWANDDSNCSYAEMSSPRDQ